jgi:hypothetical protein
MIKISRELKCGKKIVTCSDKASMIIKRIFNFYSIGQEDVCSLCSLINSLNNFEQISH